MALERFRRIFGIKLEKKQDEREAVAEPTLVRVKHKSVAQRSKKWRKQRKSHSPYTNNVPLQKKALQMIHDELKKSPQAYRSDKLTLLEIADAILQKNLQLPRPTQLRAHDIFFMLTEKRQRKGVSGACLVWRGAAKAGIPTMTTVNAQQRSRLQVDARIYILENPPKGARRRLRTLAQNTCGNPLCVNVRHIKLVSKNPLSHQGENHPRAKFSDATIVKMARDYNAGMTAREIGKKYRIHPIYVEQIMRKEKRTQATQGLTIRGRFSAR